MSENDLRLKFKKITFEDKPLIEKYIKRKQGLACNFTIGQLFMWKDYLDTMIAEYNNNLYIHAISEGYFTVVVPDIKINTEYFDVIEEYFDSINEDFRLFVYCDDCLGVIKSKYQDIEIEEEPQEFDYIYDFNQFIDYPGKKMSKQRNHVNSFNKMYPNYSFKKIEDKDLYRIKEFEKSHEVYSEETSEIGKYEAAKCIELLENYDTYGLTGAYLEVNGDIVGYSIGEVIDDVLYIQIEKANYTYKGAYQKLACEFAKLFIDMDIKYINREEDVGDEGIKKSKLSYHPTKLLKKYSVRKIRKD